MKAAAGLATRVATSLDLFVSRGVTGRGAQRRSRAERLGPEERLRALAAIQEAYAAAEPLDQVTHFFGAPDRLALSERVIGTRRVRGETFEVVDVTFPTRTQPFLEGLTHPFFSHAENRTGALRWFRGAAPSGGRRGAVIVVHGYRSGNLAVEQRVWPVDYLLANGLDVVLYVLPMHGRRAPRGLGPQFPAADPRLTIEGFRQAIFELKSLVRTLRERGAPHVGAIGMSLGGYTVSLLATVTELDFLGPLIPLASIADIAEEAGRLVGSVEEQAAQHAAIEAAYRVVSPFARTPRVAPDAVVVMGGEADAITPIRHAEKLAAHFQSELVRFRGGHLLQFGRSEGFRALGRMLRERGIFRPRS